MAPHLLSCSPDLPAKFCQLLSPGPWIWESNLDSDEPDSGLRHPTDTKSLCTPPPLCLPHLTWTVLSRPSFWLLSHFSSPLGLRACPTAKAMLPKTKTALGTIVLNWKANVMLQLVDSLFSQWMYLVNRNEWSSCSTEPLDVIGSPATWVYVTEGAETGWQPCPFIVQHHHHQETSCVFINSIIHGSSMSGYFSQHRRGELPLDFKR